MNVTPVIDVSGLHKWYIKGYAILHWSCTTCNICKHVHTQTVQPDLSKSITLGVNWRPGVLNKKIIKVDESCSFSHPHRCALSAFCAAIAVKPAEKRKRKNTGSVHIDSRTINYVIWCLRQLLRRFTESHFLGFLVCV